MHIGYDIGAIYFHYLFCCTPKHNGQSLEKRPDAFLQNRDESNDGNNIDESGDEGDTEDIDSDTEDSEDGGDDGEEDSARGGSDGVKLHHYYESHTHISCPWCQIVPQSSNTNTHMNKTRCLLASRYSSDSADTAQHINWSADTRAHLTDLLIHLQTFHCDFHYYLFADCNHNLRIVVTKEQDVRDHSQTSGEGVGGGGKRKRKRLPHTASYSADDTHNETCPNVAVIGSSRHFVSAGRAVESLEHFAVKYIDHVPVCPDLLLPPASTATPKSENIAKLCDLSRKELNDDRASVCSDVDHDRGGEQMKCDESESTSIHEVCGGDDESEGDEGDDLTKVKDCAGNVGDVCYSDADKTSQQGSFSRVFCTSDGQVERDMERFHNTDTVINELWMTEHTNRDIGEYLDVNLIEKVFMCKWNQHVASCRSVYADIYMSNISELFARRYAPFLLRHQLRYVFLLHLISLWDHSLLAFDDITICMCIVDNASN